MLPTHFWGGAAAPYQIDQSLRFNSADSYTFRRTPGSDSTSQKKFTVSAWVKRGVIASGATNNVGRQLIFYTGLSNGAGNLFDLEWNDDKILAYFNGAGSINPQTVAKFRDPSAWYHIVVAVDTAQATTADRFKIYVNGTEQALTGTLPTLDLAVTNGTTSIHAVAEIGTLRGNQYISELYYINDQQLTPGDFGELNTDGVWIPKKYAGTFAGTNSCYLKFDPSATNGIGHDHSGNGNNFTTTNFTTSGTGTDVMSDTPTTNWCTWNPLDKNPNLTLSDGNLRVTPSAASSARGTIGVATNLWYWECTVISTSGNWAAFGIGDSRHSLTSYPGTSTFGASYYGFNGFVTINNSNVATLSTSAANDIIGVAVDLNNDKIWFSKNGTWMGTGTQDPATNQGGISISARGTSTIFPIVGGGTPAAGACEFNFGQRAFAYTPPTGFEALNTANLPEPTIKDGSEYFNTVLWTGNTSTTGVTQAITGVGFQPDFVWAKTRNQAFNHFLFDSVRGVGASGKRLASNNTDAEATNGEIDSFDSDGFTVKYVDTNSLNWSSANNVGWCWKEGATPGFDIVTFTSDGVTTGGTFAHALGIAPKMVIYKGRNTTDNWYVYHADVGANSALFLNLTNGSTATGVFNNAAPTSSVIQLKQSSWGAGNLVAYCFSEVEGFSKFDSYTGNGLADGPFVYCGFRPRFLLIKGTSASTNWEMIDTARDTYNVADEQIFANLSTTYPNYIFGDVLSNGFKIRDNSSGLQGNYNSSGQTYVFAAFAEHPFKYANAR